MIDIEVKNLTKTFLQPDSNNKHQYKYLNVLNNLNLEIKNNEVISLIGPSGIGKSTLLNILSGFDSNYQGIININRNIAGQKFSFIFHIEFSSISHLDVIIGVTGYIPSPP